MARNYTIEYTVYRYAELSQDAKEKVKQWLLDSDMRNKIFAEYCDAYLRENFPNSELKVNYSLSYCQGDGLNINGNIAFIDMFDKVDLTEKEQRTLNHYLPMMDYNYSFYKNNHYEYSCKFIDKQYIDNVIDEQIENLKYYSYKNINTELIKKFYYSVIDYFTQLDQKWEKDGYEYL